MADHEIVEMSQLLEAVQSFDGALNTADEVIDHPDHQELRRIVVASTAPQDGAPPPQHGPEEIDDDCEDRDDHP